MKNRVFILADMSIAAVGAENFIDVHGAARKQISTAGNHLDIVFSSWEIRSAYVFSGSEGDGGALLLGHLCGQIGQLLLL